LECIEKKFIDKKLEFNEMKIFALSGSVREQSYNSGLLNALANISDESLQFEIYKNLKSLPIFDPALADENTPQSVLAFKAFLAASDAVIISTPEYAHGVTGVLKNALDWVVNAPELVLKPVAVMSVSTSGLGGLRAQNALIMTLVAMNWNVVVEGSLNIPYASRRFNRDLSISDELTKKRMKISLDSLVRAAKDLR